MAKEISIEDYERIKHLAPKDDAELEAALSATPGEAEAETATALGGGADIGSATIPPITAGMLPNLEAIGSNFLDETAEDFSVTDIMHAAYVLKHGHNAVRPIRNILRRRSALEKLKPLAEKSPEFFAQYLAATDRLEQCWIEFDDAAQAWWDGLGPIDIDEAGRVIVDALNAAFSGFAAIPSTGADDSKKKPASTANGSE